MKRFLSVILASALVTLGLTAIPASAANQLVSHTIDCNGNTSSQDGLSYTADLVGTAYRAYVQLSGTAPVDVSVTLVNCPFYSYNNGSSSGTVSGISPTNPYTISTFTVSPGFTGEGGGRVGLKFFYIYFKNTTPPPTDGIVYSCDSDDSVLNVNASDGTTASWSFTFTENDSPDKVNYWYSLTGQWSDGGGEQFIDTLSTPLAELSGVFVSPAWAADKAGLTYTVRVKPSPVPNADGVPDNTAPTLCLVEFKFNVPQFSITSGCKFNGFPDLVLDVGPGGSYDIRQQGAGLTEDSNEYVAWVEWHTPEGITEFQSLTDVAGDTTITAPYDSVGSDTGIGSLMDLLLTDTLIWKFFPVIDGDGGWEKSGDTPACSITFNREPAFTVQGLGYWKNTGIYDDVNPETNPVILGDGLYTYTVDTRSEATGVFNSTNCGVKNPDAVGCLAGHLLTAKFNAEAGADASCMADIFADADNFLEDKGYTGPGKYSLSKSDRSYALSLKEDLEDFNEYGCSIDG